MPPRFSTWETKSDVLEGARDVAITLWPFRKARRARLRPKPDEQPVMNHTGELGSDDIVAVRND